MGMDFRGLVWKRVGKKTFFGLKLGQELENRTAHPHQEFPGVLPEGKRHLAKFSLVVYCSLHVRKDKYLCERFIQGNYFVCQVFIGHYLMWECKSDLHFEVNSILNLPYIAYTNRQPLSSLGFDFYKRVLATWSPIFSQFPSLMSFSLYFSGVYFTSFSPDDHSIKSIRRNNFDDRGRALMGNNLLYKLEWVVQVEMDINEVTQVPANDRDVYLYNGNVDLSKYTHSIYKNPNA